MLTNTVSQSRTDSTTPSQSASSAPVGHTTTSYGSPDGTTPPGGATSGAPIP